MGNLWLNSLQIMLHLLMMGNLNIGFTWWMGYSQDLVNPLGFLGNVFLHENNVLNIFFLVLFVYIFFMIAFKELVTKLC